MKQHGGALLLDRRSPHGRGTQAWRVDSTQGLPGIEPGSRSAVVGVHPALKPPKCKTFSIAKDESLANRTTEGAPANVGYDGIDDETKSEG
jgi:hypothetical protein